MTYWNHYHTPVTVDEATTLLKRYNGSARIIGGGTDLLLEIQQGHRPSVEAMIDPSRIAVMSQLSEEEGYFVIGGAVTHSSIVLHPKIRQHGTCLVESCGVIGGPQVRNVGTLAGNVAHALPAGDGTIGLLTLGADVEIASSEGIVWTPMEKTFLGPGKSSVDPTLMMIARLRFRPTGSSEGSAYRRVMRPQGVALPMISMGARIKLAGRSMISGCRIALGPAGTTPFQAKKTMDWLVGKTSEAEVFQEAARMVLQEAVLRDSMHRATAEYRREMIMTYLPKTLAKAAERALTGHAEPENVGE